MIKMVITGNIGSSKTFSFKDKDGEKTGLRISVASHDRGKAEPTWIDVVVWRGDKVAQYATKGRKVAVSGKLVTRKATKDGVNVTYFECHADYDGLEFLDSSKATATRADDSAESMRPDDEVLAGL